MGKSSDDFAGLRGILESVDGHGHNLRGGCRTCHALDEGIAIVDRLAAHLARLEAVAESARRWAATRYFRRDVSNADREAMAVQENALRLAVRALDAPAGGEENPR